MEKLLESIIEKNKHLVELGNVASYIPALSKANPNHIGISVIDKDGHIYSAGDYKEKFTIQSISKVLALIVALMELGEKKVFQKVGYNGSENSFNNIINLDYSNTIFPTNPMINAGAIVITSLIEGSGEEKFNKILNLTRVITGNKEIICNEEVYLSEKETGDRNRAIAYLMKSKNMITGNVDEILDAYFKQCSMEIDTIDLAKIGFFISNGCKSLRDNKYISSDSITSLILSIMTNCGMYDYSGEYSIKVGVPSKSGVAGGLLGSVRNTFGIGLYSPVLDNKGNPLVGISIMEDLSIELGLNLFQ